MYLVMRCLLTRSCKNWYDKCKVQSARSFKNWYDECKVLAAFL
jgi:hypothetical protein